MKSLKNSILLEFFDLSYFSFYFNNNNFENRCRTCNAKKYKTEPTSEEEGGEVVSSLYFLHFLSPSVHFHSENSRPAHGSHSPTATVNYNIISVTQILSVIDERRRYTRNVIIINFFPIESASGQRRAFASKQPKPPPPKDSSTL